MCLEDLADTEAEIALDMVLLLSAEQTGGLDEQDDGHDHENDHVGRFGVEHPCQPFDDAQAEAGQPLFGICYGHQLIAHALGGRVDDNPQGREMGTVCLDLANGAGQDPLFDGFPGQVPAQATHLQTVVQPPPGARVLAVSGRDNCQAFRWGEAAWGVQFHPEFSTGMMRGYIHARSEALANEGTCHASLSKAVRPAPLARRVLQRFIHQAHRRGRHEGTR
mgnify:CR=1 FL=1